MECWRSTEAPCIWRLVVSQGECVHVHEFEGVKVNIYHFDFSRGQYYVHAVLGLKAGPFPSLKSAILGSTMLLAMEYAVSKSNDTGEG
jgi:hypothetical protein